MAETRITTKRTRHQKEHQESWDLLHGHDNYKHQILTKFFPSIRYGRDTDLDQYISLRERGKPLKEWKGYYDNLVRKYTENERKKLIQSIRRHLQHFQHVFKQILEGLYSRIETLLKRQIETLLILFEDVSSQDFTSFSNQDFFSRIGQALNLFSPDRYEALNHLELLNEFARKIHYHTESLEKVTHFISGYLNGSLFLEKKQNQSYHFDINAEKAQSPYRQKTVRETPLPVQLFLSPEDIDKILLDEQNLNEYELCFAYLDKYIQLLEDEDFATKVFVYSKKNKTAHYQIFDRIRKGILLNHQKERIFDDVFKIICAGRYVYNIRLEKFMSYKLRLLTNNLNKQNNKQARQNLKQGNKKDPRSKESKKQDERGQKSITKKDKKQTTLLKVTPTTGRNHNSPVRQQVSKHQKNGKGVQKAKINRKLAAKDRILIKKALSAKNKNVSSFASLHSPLSIRETLSVTEMIRELCGQKHVQRRLIDEFKKRLPDYIRETRSFGMLIPGIENNQDVNKTEIQAGTRADKQQEELIKFVLQNYDKILIEHEQTDLYREKFEQLGSSLYTIYTAILNCLNKLKTDYITQREKFEKNSGLFFFNR